MNKILLLSIIFSLILSCKNKEIRTEEKATEFCVNELDLLCSFDSIPLFKGDFRLINSDIKQELSELFKGDNCCNNLHFNVLQKVDSIDTIKLSLHYFYNCDHCPIYMRTRNDLVLLLNAQGQILFEGEIITIDSLNTELYHYYLKIGKLDYLPDTYDKVNISLQWDLDVSETNFTTYINQIIQGYLRFLDKFSKVKYNKKICQLNRYELENVANHIPLRIEIPTKEVIDEEHDIEFKKKKN